MRPPLARPTSLWKTFFYPSHGTLLFCLCWGLASYFIAGLPWYSATLCASGALLTYQTSSAAFEFVERRYPSLSSALTCIISIAFVAWGAVFLIHSGIVTELISFRPDWGGAAFILVFGLITIIAVWPPYWLFNRYIQPWALRSDNRMAGVAAISALALAYWGAWLAALLFLVSRN